MGARREGLDVVKRVGGGKEREGDGKGGEI